MGRLTGYFDKNGTLIKEGDIVKCDGGSFPAEVVYCEEFNFWGLETYREETRNNPNEMYFFEESIIIGNINNSPDLLPSKNKS